MLHLIENGEEINVNTAKSGPIMVSIRELDGIKFEIPEYQRGFRWTRQQIRELINDLYDFSRDTTQQKYCLQNITVRRKDCADQEIYEVIDGQQRLTAIWILIMVFLDYDEYSRNKMPIYAFNYVGKESLTKYVSDITQRISGLREEDKGKLILNVENGQDVDSSYIHDAFYYIIKEYKFNDIPFIVTLRKIFDGEFIDGKKKICVIWNEITPNGVEECDRTRYVIERFSNLNANKIPLTESELIKAAFINKFMQERKKDKSQEFSLQWEEMERRFNNDAFWCFISSGENSETRIDLLFQIYLKENDYLDDNGQHVLSRFVNDKLKSDSASNVWNKIVQIYDTLNDWYNDYFYYHMIGLLISIEDRPVSTVIEELYGEYDSLNKREFKKALKKRIRTQKRLEVLFGGNNEQKGDWEIEHQEDIRIDSDDISYDKNKGLVKNILLMFNISLLVNAYNKNPENAVERFSFKIYKDKKNPIEIEHINPQHLEGQSSAEENKKDWAIKTAGIIENDEERGKIQNEVNSADWGNENSRVLVDKIKNAARLDNLSNLTLLDKKLNSSYVDNFFIEKRNHILAARFGTPVFNIKEYDQSVIFPGTMWVFMRQYTLNSSSDFEKNNITDRWNATDRKNYIKYMKENIYQLLTEKNREDGNQE